MLFVEYCIRQHNSPERFQLLYFDESIEKFMSSGKDILIMGDFNIDLLKCNSSFIATTFYRPFKVISLLTVIDKPTSSRSTSATFIDDIFINNPDKVVACGNFLPT